MALSQYLDWSVYMPDYITAPMPWILATPICGQNCEDPKEVPVWGFQVLMDNWEGLHMTFALYNNVYAYYIPGVSLVYPVFSKTCHLDTIVFVSLNAMLWTCISSSSNMHSFFESWQHLNIIITSICIAYPMHLPGIYLVCTMNLCCVVLKEKDAFLKKLALTLDCLQTWHGFRALEYK